MKITVLSDNLGSGALEGEWGLSLHVEYEGIQYLLDTGGSDRFISNAESLGIDVRDIDHAVLSHAHYDHSLGMEPFFKVNSKSDFYMSPHSAENCYAGWKLLGRYIGLPRGVMEAYSHRIRMPEGVAAVSAGVYLVPHTTPGLAAAGRKSHLYVRKGPLRYCADDFSHEQSLVFRVDSGLVVMNSCSHAGFDVIAGEVYKAFPDEKIISYVGGLHLFRLSDKEVREIASKIKETGINAIYTGHCTGEKAFRILKDELGPSVHQFYCGMEICL